MICIKSELQMQDLAMAFAKNAQSPLVIYLSGELGAGKTTFTRGFLRGLGYNGAVKSPTYTLVESYQFPNMEIFHFDFYRIHDAEELELIGIREYFHNNAICIIEWPEQARGRIAPADIIVNFEVVDDFRQLIFSTVTSQGDKIIQNLLQQYKQP